MKFDEPFQLNSCLFDSYSWLLKYSYLYIYFVFIKILEFATERI